MAVPMMQVRQMRMSVGHRLVRMCVAVWLLPLTAIVRVPMVLVVDMAVPRA